MEDVLSSSALEAFSPFQLTALLAVFALISVFIARVLANAFPGSKPPVFEGVPFVGGLQKFAGVSGGETDQQCYQEFLRV
jgi:hypothetical protein